MLILCQRNNADSLKKESRKLIIINTYFNINKQEFVLLRGQETSCDECNSEVGLVL